MSPTFSSCRWKKTDGPVLESMCPAITAGPGSPGAVPSAYQPASSKLGGMSLPLSSSPSGSRSVVRWMAEIFSCVGGLVAGATAGAWVGGGDGDGVADRDGDGLSQAPAAPMSAPD